MANKALRQKAKDSHVTQWRIADALGITEFTLTRWLRYTLSPEKEKRILSVIDMLAKEDAEDE